MWGKAAPVAPAWVTAKGPAAGKSAKAKGAKAAVGKGKAVGGAVVAAVGKAVGGPNPALDRLENEFSTLADKHIQLLTDCNVSCDRVWMGFEQLMASRGKVLAARGLGPVGGKGAKASKGGGKAFSWSEPAPVAAAAEPAKIGWKQLLAVQLAKAGHQAGGGSIVYEVADTDPTAKQGGARFGAWAIVTAMGLEGQDPPSFEGELAISKKAAENEAAKAAMHGLFPDAAMAAEAGAQAGGWGAPPAWATAAFGGQPPAKKQKVMPTDAKSILNNSLAILMERSLPKDELKWDVSEIDDGGVRAFSCVLTINPYDNMTFEGPSTPSKKDAEQACAQLAIDALEPDVQPLRDAKAEKKKKKNQEQLAALKEATKAKKDAKKAEMGEAEPEE